MDSFSRPRTRQEDHTLAQSLGYGIGDDSFQDAVDDRHARDRSPSSWRNKRARSEEEEPEASKRRRPQCPGDVFWNYYTDEDIASPSGNGEAEGLVNALKQWLVEQPEISARDSQFAWEICERLVSLEILSVAHLAAISEQDLVHCWSSRSDGLHTRLAHAANPSRNLIKLANSTAQSYLHPSGSSSSASDHGVILEALRPMFDAMKGATQATAKATKTQRQVLEKVLKHGRDTKKEDVAESSSDDEGDASRVDIGRLFEEARSAKGDLAKYVLDDWCGDTKRLGRAKRRAERKDKSVPRLFESSAADWTPPWVAQAACSEEESKKLKNTRKARVGSSVAAYLANSASESFAYLASDELPVMAPLSSTSSQQI